MYLHYVNAGSPHRKPRGISTHCFKKQTNRKAGEVTTITIMVIANAQRNRVKNQDIETLALYEDRFFQDFHLKTEYPRYHIKLF